ncbi:MAG: hypothetical protein AB7N80_08585 [Bdellovibrionales bacterium]
MHKFGFKIAGLLPLVCFAFAVTASQGLPAGSPCDGPLTFHIYARSTHLSTHSDPAIRRLSLNPEPGSLASRHQDLARDFVRLHQILQEATYNEATLAGLDQALDAIDRRYKGGPTLQTTTDFLRELLREEAQLMRSPQRRAPQFHLERLRWLMANVWQAVVATHFHAKELSFNQRLTEMFPWHVARYERKVGATAAAPVRGSEIDILVTRHGGRQVWVEVKDWSLSKTSAPSELEGLARQCRNLLKARAVVRQSDAEVIVVLKHGGIGHKLRQRYLRLPCHQTLFMFPFD